jgi:2-dehydropantoate 2-reductase
MADAAAIPSAARVGRISIFMLSRDYIVMRVLVLGAGGTGGYFGGRLVEVGKDVTFLVRPKRAEQIRANGLVLKSPHGDACLKPKAITAVEEAYDLVILSNKAYDLDAAIEAVAPAVEKGADVLPLLNGMRHLDVLDARFGSSKVLGGWCAISATLDPDGTVRQLSQAQTLKFGERDGSRSGRVEEIEALMTGAAFDGRSTDRIMQEMWDKWVGLSTLAGMTCLMRASVGNIMEAPGGEALTMAMLGEGRAIAKAYGLAVGGEADQRMTGVLTERGSGFTASMLRDIENRGRIESDHVVGDLLARARAKGIATPMLEIAYCHLKAYELRFS